MGKKNVQPDVQEPEVEQVEDMMTDVENEFEEENREALEEEAIDVEGSCDGEANAGEESVEEVSPEVLALEEEKKVLIDRISRLQADFDNYRRRSLQEKEELRARANENLLIEFLPIMDNFERALESGDGNEEGFFKGVAMIYRQMLNFLEKEGVNSFESEGEIFDHNKHHAVMKEPAPEGITEDTIIQVLQKGYMYQDRVLRPAMVKVAE